MPHEIRVPRLGWSMEEGVFVAWRKQDGEHVRRGDILFELEGEKASQEIESLDEGILRIPPDGPQPGAIVAVGALLGHLLAEGETLDLAPTSTTPTSVPRSIDLPSPSSTTPERTLPKVHVVATPRARRAANELGLDWRVFQGSGRGGRIRERDVRSSPSPQPLSRSVPVSRLRSVIAERMLCSARETAPVTLTTRADATGLVAWRDRLKRESGDDPVPSYTDLIVKLTAETLREHPLLAGRWCGDRIELPNDDGFHIGFAVDAPEGLVVPVLRNVVHRTIAELTADSRRLIDAARHGRLQSSDMQGGVFTVTSLGAFGVDAFTPIINLPEAAVLGLGAIRREPIVMDDGAIAARHCMTLSLTFDHRLLDGAPAARFLQDLTRRLENSSGS